MIDLCVKCESTVKHYRYDICDEDSQNTRQNHSHLTARLSAKLDDLFLRPSFHGQIFFDKEGLSQKNMLLLTQFC